MIEVRVSTNGKEFVDLHILNVTHMHYPKGEDGEGKVKFYQIMNIAGKPVFQVLDNSRWDNVVIPAIHAAMAAYNKQGANPELQL